MKVLSRILGLNMRKFIVLIVALSVLKCLVIYGLVKIAVGQSEFTTLPDSRMYDTLAKNLISGNGFSLEKKAPFFPTMFKEPIYALFIAVIYLIFGQQLNYVIIAQVFLSSFIAVFIYLIGKQLFEEKICRFAALLVCFMPIFGEISFFVQVEALYIPLILLFIYLMVMAFKQDKIVYYLLSGITLGLCSLTRNIAFYLFFLILILIILGYGKTLDFNKTEFIRRRALKIFVFVISFLLIVSPWILRNNKKFKVYQISSRGGSIFLAQATRAEGITKRGLSAYLMYLLSGHMAQKQFPDIIGSDFGVYEYQFFNDPLQNAKGENLTEGQRDENFAKEGFKKMFSHPVKFFTFSAVSYLQIFKYFTPWSFLTLEINDKPAVNLYTSAVRFLLGLPLGIIFSFMTILGIYFSRAKVVKYLLLIVLFVYYHFILFFMSGVPGCTVPRIILHIVPLYSFFVCIFIINISNKIKHGYFIN